MSTDSETNFQFKKYFNQFLFFDNFLITKFYTFIYWIFLVLAVILSIGLMFQNIFAGLIGLILSLVAVRLFFEFAIIVFKIYDVLKEILEIIKSNVNNEIKEENKQFKEELKESEIVEITDIKDEKANN